MIKVHQGKGEQLFGSAGSGAGIKPTLSRTALNKLGKTQLTLNDYGKITPLGGAGREPALLLNLIGKDTP